MACERRFLWIGVAIGAALVALSITVISQLGPTAAQAANPAMLQIQVQHQPQRDAACMGSAIPYRITINNVGSDTLSKVTLIARYTSDCLAFIESAPSLDSIEPGLPTTDAIWEDLVPRFGPLDPGQTITVTLSLRAMSACLAASDALVTAYDEQGGVVTATASAMVPVQPPSACLDELITNGDFQSGDLSDWTVGGALAFPPSHIEIVAPGHYSSRALFLGNGHGEGSALNTTWVEQQIAIPVNAAGASLSFWYKTETTTSDPVDDCFVVEIVNGSARSLVLSQGDSNGWTRHQVDLSAHVGHFVTLRFAVSQDGQPAPFGAYVDDVSCCLLACEPTIWEPPPPPYDWCPAHGATTYPDYAPVGMPDFGQLQQAWQVGGQWNWDAPVAAANVLWWLDSRYEVNVSAPPANVDHYPLVETYRQAWDDHDSRNVVPLVKELAYFMDTEANGTTALTLQQGLQDYVTSKGLRDAWRIVHRAEPSIAWLRQALRDGGAVILQLVFRQVGSEMDQSLGAHYVTLVQVGCWEDLVVVSDPFLDQAERGFPGYVQPWGLHGHAAAPPDAGHNDVAFVSHDAYRIMPDGLFCQLERYPTDQDVLGNYWGQNVMRGPQEQGAGPVQVVVAGAVAILPAPDVPWLRLVPDVQPGLVGQVVELELMADTGQIGVDRAELHLDYDPALVQIVDGSGEPADHILPGTAFVSVERNAVDAQAGRIDFVTTSPAYQAGRLLLARVQLMLLGPTPQGETCLAWHMDAPRSTGLWHGVTMLPTNKRDGQLAIAPGAALQGVADWQARPPPPDPAHEQMLSARLYRPGSDDLWLTRYALTDDQGEFELRGLAPGDYDIAVKGLHTLGQRLLNVALLSGDTAITWNGLYEGDVNGDNRISLLDASVLDGSYGAERGKDHYAAMADLNGDGAVDMADVALLADNLGLVGDVTGTMPAGAALESAVALRVSSDPPDVTLSVEPSPLDRLAGETVTLALRVMSRGQPVDGVAIHLSYDSAFLTPVDATGQLTDRLVLGSAFDRAYLNEIDAETGEIRFVAANLGGDPVLGTAETVAWLRLAIAPTAAGETWLRFRTRGSIQTMAAHAGAALPLALEPGSIVMRPIATPTATPFVQRLPLLLRQCLDGDH